MEDTLLALLLGGMVLLAAAQIILRNGFESGLTWADPVLRVMVLWLGLLGALAASRDNKQIHIDLLVRVLPNRLRQLVDSLANLFTAAVSALVAGYGVRFVVMELEAGGEVVPGLPAWLAESVIPLAFGLIALRYLVHAALSLRRFLVPASTP